MTHLFILWLALFAAQAPTPAAPSTQPPAAQPAQPASATTPNQAAPAEPPSPNPDVSVIHQVGGGVTPPKALSIPEPSFTPLARKQRVSGIVTVQLIVDAQGNPQYVHVSKSLADSVDQKHREAALSLDQAALDAVKQYKFAPATIDGKPVAVYLNVEVNFKLF